MNYKLLIINFLFLIFKVDAQEKYHFVEINLKDYPIPQITMAGVMLDHMHTTENTLKYVFEDRELQLLEEAGIGFKVLVEDYANGRAQSLSNQLSQNRSSNLTEASVVCQNYLNGHGYSGKTNFEFGSMGGFYTYTEMLDQLDDMARQYPNLISRRREIGNFRTHEGRAIYSITISDNPTVQENEPSLLITAMHHSREPVTMQQAIYTMWYLLENYEGDARIKEMVDNLQIVFVPCINPDGYIYNQTTNPNGGGLWRKNRRDNGDGTYGVDLNRNYGYNWGYDNRGSSDQTESLGYRGPAPFSEPETQAVKWLCEQYDFDLSINYHSFGDFLVRPWGYSTLAETTPEDADIYKALLQELTYENKFNSGTGVQTVGYTTNGDADDWMFGERTSKEKMYSMSPEVGHPDEGGFWPDLHFIEPQCAKSLIMNLKACEFLLTQVRIEETNEPIVEELDFNIDLRLRWLGLTPWQSGTISFRDLNQNLINIPNKEIIFPTENNITERSYFFQLESNANPDDPIAIEVEIDNNYRIIKDTIHRIYRPFGPRIDLIQDNATFLSRGSTNGRVWGITERSYYSPPSSITDSPNGNYAPNTSNEIEFEGPIQIVETGSEESSFLHYKLRYDLVNDGINTNRNYDYLRVLISTDGTNYIPICAPHTVPCAVEGPHQGEPVYMGTQSEWLLEQIDLSPYEGMNIWIKFELISNTQETADGVYLDDIFIDYNIISSSSIVEDITEEITYYPNPVIDKLYIQSELYQINELQSSLRAEESTFVVRNALGQIVSQKDLSSDLTEIALDHLPSGIYFIQLRNPQLSESVPIGKFLKID